MGHRSSFGRIAGRTALIAFALLLISPAVSLAQTGNAEGTPTAESGSGAVLVYHQITNLNDDVGGVGYPVLSADGERAVFADSPGSGDPATPNRIYVINADGSGLTEVDSYTTLCYCASEVDISEDGQTVVSTEAVQVRIADAGGGRELINLSSGEITALRISGDGQTVVFLVRRSTATRDGAETLERGIWAIDADGSNLRQIVGAEDVADSLGVPFEPEGCCFHSDWSPLAVSTDGGEIAFGAYAAGTEHLLAVDGEGGTPRALYSPLSYVRAIAISGDGSTVGYDVVPTDTQGANEIGVVAFEGAEPFTLTTNPQNDAGNGVDLSADGSTLLLSSASILFDTETGEARQLAVLTPGAGGHDAVLVDGTARATMNADATRLLYAMRTVRCADCLNAHEQLAILDIAPADLGAAPDISDPTLDPDEIPLNYESATTATAAVEATGELIAVGLVALRDGLYDINVGRGVMLHDDGLEGDVTAGDGVFSNNAVVHLGAATREDDTGPRTVRISAEVETSDGLRHATAVEIGPLTVVAPL